MFYVNSRYMGKNIICLVLDMTFIKYHTRQYDSEDYAFTKLLKYAE